MISSNGRCYNRNQVLTKAWWPMPRLGSSEAVRQEVRMSLSGPGLHKQGAGRGCQAQRRGSGPPLATFYFHIWEFELKADKI